MRLLAIAVFLCAGAPAAFADKASECKLQGEVMSAVQQARLDRVSKDSAPDKIVADNPDWPEGLSTALPALVEYVYGLKRRDLKNADLGAAAEASCLENWEQIQAMKKSVTN